MNIAVSSFQRNIPSRFQLAVLVNDEIALARRIIRICAGLHGNIAILGVRHARNGNCTKLRCKSNILVRRNSIYICTVISNMNLAFFGSNCHIPFIFISNVFTLCYNLVFNGYITSTGYKRNISIIGYNQIIYRNVPIPGRQGCILPGRYASANTYVSISSS